MPNEHSHPDPVPGSASTTRPMRLAFFHAPWCGVCHEKAPLVEEIAASLGLPLESWDIEEAAGRAEAERRRIRTASTLALIQGERVPFRLVGRMITPENVRHLMAQVLTSSASTSHEDPCTD